jgi:pimeloyl-ACP methyl ester carboxylesterase
LSQFIGFIKVPTVIIWGDKDKATPVQDAYFMKNKIKGAKLEIIIGAGHVLNRECPEVLTVKILENV